MSWTDFAACVTHPEINWVPAGNGRGLTLAGRENLDAARSVCRSCDVRGRCLDEAIQNNLEGIWGGTTEGQRRSLRRNWRSADDRDVDLLFRLQREAR